MNKTLLALAVAASLAAHAGTAAAQGSGTRPWYVGVVQDFTHESNVFSQPSGSKTSDTISTTTLRGGLNAQLGRQRAYARASVFHKRYADLDGLDSTGYDAGLGLDWATIERLSGTLAANATQRQADFNSGIATTSLKNTERSEDVTATVRLGGDGLLGLEGSLGHRRVTFSAPEFAAQQYRRNSGSVGVTYRPSGSLTLGAGVATQKTEYLDPLPSQTVPDANQRDDVYLSATWVATGASTLAARVNIGKTEYDQASAADYDGVTGSLSWAWKPTGLLSLNTVLARDTGQDAGFRRAADGNALPSATDFSRTTDTLSVSAAYELTAKVSVTANASVARRSLVDVVTASTGRDRTSRLSLGATWAATRVISAGCNVAHESRSASGSVSSDYTNDRFGCFVSATLD
ncbi:MAG TPA: hypothetical protein VFQ16_01185 [Burkholderiaceae bacterium]|nr:hypothetical protein [Burkholderiaceae bacterium]